MVDSQQFTERFVTFSLLGSGAVRPVDELRQQLAMLEDLTDRPFIVNFTQPWLQQNPQTFDVALEYTPAVVSLALGDPAELPERAHDAGALFIQQVHTREQAELVAECAGFRAFPYRFRDSRGLLADSARGKPSEVVHIGFRARKG